MVIDFKNRSHLEIASHLFLEGYDVSVLLADYRSLPCGTSHKQFYCVTLISYSLFLIQITHETSSG